MTCPPCTNDCNEGRTCPARNKILEEDDDIQDYKKPWVGLTDEEIEQGCKELWMTEQAWQSAVYWAEAKLKEKNQ